MKDLRTRKYKNYTAVYIDHFTRKTALEASNLKKSIAGNVVVKPSKKGLLRYIEEYKPEFKMQVTKSGHIFEIAGIIFKIIKKQKNGMIWLECNHEIFGTYSNYNPLIEFVYENITGALLFF